VRTIGRKCAFQDLAPDLILDFDHYLSELLAVLVRCVRLSEDG
jgi:hypothetical protein